MWVRSLAPPIGLRICIAASCSIGHRFGLDLAVAGICSSIWPLAWVLPYAAGVALKRKKKVAGLFYIFQWMSDPLSAYLTVFGRVCIDFSCCSFNLPFPDGYWYRCFHVLICICISSLVKCLLTSFAQVLIGLFIFCCCVLRVLYILKPVFLHWICTCIVSSSWSLDVLSF